MAPIGSWWVVSHESLPDETTLCSYSVNYLPTEGRPLGGKLYLTDCRLLFSPHLLDAIFGGEAVAIELESVTDVTQLEAGERAESGHDGPMAGESTDRLHVVCADGSSHSFVVNRLESALAAIEDALGDRADGS